jgi:hypothetical protein
LGLLLGGVSECLAAFQSYRQLSSKPGAIPVENVKLKSAKPDEITAVRSAQHSTGLWKTLWIGSRSSNGRIMFATHL